MDVGLALEFLADRECVSHGNGVANEEHTGQAGIVLNRRKNWTDGTLILNLRSLGMKETDGC
jgi:hypothetical protein